MAVYTHVNRPELDAFLAAYDLGAVIAFEEIEQGVENTNYALTTTRGRFILTLFEKRASESDLPFFAAAMAHCSDHGIPAPAPVANRAGSLFGRLCLRPAAVFTFLEGRQRMAPSPKDCALMGMCAARLHLASRGFALTRPNALSIEAWRTLASRCGPRADEAAPRLAALISDELAFLETSWPLGLPSGLIHADLFPDNVFFDGDALSGVIDFYFACTDAFAYDLAITLNAWAGSASGGFSTPNARALLAGYQSVRALTADECRALPILLRGASLRILLTRLFDFLNRIDGAMVAVKDPLAYRDLLLFHRSAPATTYFGSEHD